MSRAYIHEGYTDKCLIKGVPGLYPDVWFDRTPVPAWKSEIILGKTRKESNDDKITTFMANVIKENVASWDIVDGSNKPLAIEVRNIRNLQPQVFQRMFSMILGLTPPDNAQVATKEEEDDSSLDYAALMRGITSQEAQEKN